MPLSSPSKQNTRSLSPWFSFVLVEYNLSYLGYFAVMATLALYFVSGLHLQAALAGGMMLFTSLSFRFARVFVAPLIDRFPARRTACVSLCLASLGYFALAWTDTLLFVIPLFFLIGLGHGINSLLVKTLTSYSSRTSIHEQRSAFLGYVYLAAGVNLMTALGSVLGSMVMLYLSFHSVFLCASSLYALAAIIAIFLPPLPVEASAQRWRASVRLSWHHLPLRRAMIATFLGWFLYTQYYTSLPLFVSVGLHRPDLLSSVFGVNAILIVAQIPFGKLLLSHRLPVSQAVLLAFVSFAGGYGLLWLFPVWQMLYPAVIVWTLGELLLIPALDTQVAEGARSQQRQIAFTLNSMVIGLGEGLGNLAGLSIMGWLLPSGGVPFFYCLLVVVALGAIGIVTLIGNPRESLIIRKVRGLSWIPTGQTNALPPLSSPWLQARIRQKVEDWFNASYFPHEEEHASRERDLSPRQMPLQDTDRSRPSDACSPSGRGDDPDATLIIRRNPLS